MAPLSTDRRPAAPTAPRTRLAILFLLVALAIIVPFLIWNDAITAAVHTFLQHAVEGVSGRLTAMEHTLATMRAGSERVQLAEAAAADVLKAEYETKKKQRLPFVIVPAAPLNMGIDDKDGNGVHSLACYKN